MELRISVGILNRNKWTTSRGDAEYSGRGKPKKELSIWIPTEISRIFWYNGKHPWMGWVSRLRTELYDPNKGWNLHHYTLYTRPLPCKLAQLTQTFIGRVHNNKVNANINRLLIFNLRSLSKIARVIGLNWSREFPLPSDIKVTECVITITHKNRAVFFRLQTYMASSSRFSEVEKEKLLK